MVIARLAAVASIAVALAGGACTHDPAELIAEINTTIYLVGVSDGDVAEIVIDGETRRASVEGSDDDEDDDDLIMFRLVLPTGEHAGTVTVFDDEDGALEPERCGTFQVSLPDADATDSVVIDVDDLDECDEEPGEGEGEGEGEGDDDDRTPPLLTAPGDQRVLVGGELVVALSASDDVSAADRLTFSLDGEAQHGQAQIQGGVLQYRASDESDEDDTVRVRATDEAGNTSTAVVVLIAVEAYRSCAATAASGLATTTGSYLLRIDDDGEAQFVAHHCLFAGGDAWTLVIKAPGDDPRIAYDADWRAAELDDDDDVDTDDDELAIFPALVATPVREVLLFFRQVDVDDGVSFSILPSEGSSPWPSLADAFESATSVTRDGPTDEEWERAIGIPFIVGDECRASGMNVAVGDRHALLGVASAEDAGCTDDRRLVGFGFDGADGTYAGLHDDEGFDLPAFTFVYVR
ncbi:MAG: hypothetical protein IT383_00660 [Deltaproteobacteria bacterium]|nr:hypothetical protein [Deltaproteobacteria bacterium]